MAGNQNETETTQNGSGEKTTPGVESQFFARAYDENGQHTRDHILAGVAINELIDEVFTILTHMGFNARDSHSIIANEVYVRHRLLADKQAIKVPRTTHTKVEKS